MEFAGMAADIENTMEEIVEEGVNIRGITYG